MPLQIRRGTNAERLEETFALGELIYVTDEQKLIVGDGTTQGGIVVSTDVDTETVQNITANMFTEGNHTNIAFAYDSTAGTINATVDLSELDILDFEGVIRADGFQGSIFLDDSTLFLDAEFNTVFFDNVRSAGSIIPDEDLAYSIGDEDFRFASVHTSELFLDDALIISVGGSVDLPLGSTIDGEEIITEGGEYRITILGEDSAILLDHINQSISVETIDLREALISFETTFDFGNNLTISTEDESEIHFNTSTARLFNCNLAVNGVIDTETPPGEISTKQIGISTSRGTIDDRENLQTGDQVASFTSLAFVENQDILKSVILTSIEASTGANNFPSKMEFLIHDYQGNYSGTSLNSRGVFESPVIQTGVYDDNTDRDDKVGTPSKGMIIFNDDTGKFQGYDGTAWVDLN